MNLLLIKESAANIICISLENWGRGYQKKLLVILCKSKQNVKRLVCSMFSVNLFQMIWIVTAASTIILDAEIGIIIGIVFSVFTVTFRTQRYTTHTITLQIQIELDINRCFLFVCFRTDVYEAGLVEGTNIFKSTERYQPVILPSTIS